MSYRLRIKYIKENLDGAATLGKPLFRFIENIPQANLNLQDYRNKNECPVEERSVFEADINGHFSSNEDAKFTSMSNPNLLYFFMGGNRRLVSDNTFMSDLFNAKPSSKVFYELLIDDFKIWKYAPTKTGARTFINSGKKGVPDAALSLIEYIVQENEFIIRSFFSHESQKALLGLLKEYSKNICSEEDAVPEWTQKMKPELAKLVVMDSVLVARLANLLDILVRLAEAVESKGEQPRYLAEGLTWLFVASLLRRKLYEVQGELDIAVSSANKAAKDIGIIIPEEWPPEDPNIKAARARLMKRFSDQYAEHPSIRLLTPEPKLFPKGLPTLSNTQRTAKENDIEPLSVKEMILNSWKNPEKKHILFIGEGGIGKTVTMLHLPKEDWFSEYGIPVIYIPLQRLNVYKGELNEYINIYYRNEIDEINSLSASTWEDHPNLIILLDGFNEIPVEYRMQAELHIRSWMDRPGVQIITTSRINAFLGKRFREYTLQRLTSEACRDYLLSAGICEDDLPPKEAEIWKVINIPLMLVIFTQIDKAKVMTRDSLISELLDWKAPDSSSHIIWDYMQLELYRLTDSDGTLSILKAAAILAVAPFVCFEMAKEGKFYVEQEAFPNLLRKAVNYYSKDREMVPKQIKTIQKVFFGKEKIDPFDENRWEDHFDILTGKSVLFNEKRSTDSEGDLEIIYAPAHQTFRDVLAAIFISEGLLNSIRLKEGHPLPEELLTTADHYVKAHISEFLSDEDLEKIWNHHRLTEPENGSETWILMDVIGLQRNYDFRELNFSGLDLTHINMHGLLSKRLDICPLPSKKELFAGTKLGLYGFYSSEINSPIKDIYFSHEGRELLVTTGDGSIWYFDLESGSHCLGIKLFSSEQHDRSSFRFLDFCKIVFSPNGSYLAYACDREDVRIFDLKTTAFEFMSFNASPFLTIEMNWHDTDSIVFSPDEKYLAIVSYHLLRIYDLENGSYQDLYDTFPKKIYRVVYCQDGKQLAFISGPGSYDVTICSPENSTSYVLEHCPYRITDLSFSNDGKRLAISSYYGEIHIWNLESNDCRTLFVHNDKNINCVVFSPNGQMVASGSSYGIVTVWNLKNGSFIVLKRFQSSITSLEFSSDGRRLAIGSCSGEVTVWDYEKDSYQGLSSPKTEIENIGFSSDMTQITCIFENKIWIRNIENNTCKFVETNPEWSHRDLSPDGRLLAFVSDSSYNVLNLETGLLRTKPKQSSRICCSDFSFDGSRLAYGFMNGTIWVWNLENDTVLTFKCHSDLIQKLFLSPDGKSMACLPIDSPIQIWSLGPNSINLLEVSPFPVYELSTSANRVFLGGLGFNPAGPLWLRNMSDNSTKVVDMENHFFKFSISSNGKLLAINSIDKKIANGKNNYIQIWDLEQNTYKRLSGHLYRFDKMVFSSSGRYLAVDQGDYPTQIYDLILGNHKSLIEHPGNNESLVFFPDEKRLATISKSGVLMIWNVSSGRLIARHIIVSEINLCGASFEQAVISQHERKLLKEYGAKV